MEMLIRYATTPSTRTMTASRESCSSLTIPEASTGARERVREIERRIGQAQKPELFACVTFDEALSVLTD